MWLKVTVNAWLGSTAQQHADRHVIIFHYHIGSFVLSSSCTLAEKKAIYFKYGPVIFHVKVCFTALYGHGTAIQPIHLCFCQYTFAVPNIESSRSFQEKCSRKQEGVGFTETWVVCQTEQAKKCHRQKLNLDRKLPHNTKEPKILPVYKLKLLIL